MPLHGRIRLERVELAGLVVSPFAFLYSTIAVPRAFHIVCLHLYHNHSATRTPPPPRSQRRIDTHDSLVVDQITPHLRDDAPQDLCRILGCADQECSG